MSDFWKGVTVGLWSFAAIVYIFLVMLNAIWKGKR